MLKFETVVKAVALICTVSFAASASSQTQPTYDSGKTAFANWLKEEGCHKADKSKSEECKNIRSYMSDGAHDCNTLTTEYNKAMSEFLASCGNVPSSPGGSKSDYGCAWTFIRCNACTGSPSEEETANYKCESLDLGSRNSLLTNPIFGQLMQQQGLPPLDLTTLASRGKFNNCPEIAAADLDKLKKDLDEQRKEAKKLNKELPELKEKQNKAVAGINDKIDNLRKKMTDDTKAHRRELRDSIKAKDAANKALSDQVFAIDKEITAMIDEKAKMELASADAAVKLKQSKVQIELNCHQSASAQVGKMQAEVITNSKGNLSKNWLRGGMGSVMKLVGLSDREHWKRVANVFYQNCLASKPTLDAKDGANDAYQFALKQAAANDRSLDTKIDKARHQMSTINGACVDETTGANVESEVCKVARNAAQDAMAMSADFEATQNANNVSYQMLQQQGSQEWESYERQIAEKEAEVNDERTRLFNMESLYNMRNQIAGGTSVDKKDLSEARGKFGKLMGAADAVTSACDPKTSKKFRDADNFLLTAKPGYRSRDPDASSNRTPASPGGRRGGTQGEGTTGN